MPNIRPYDAPQGMELRPTEIGIDATLQVARRAGAFFNQAGDAVRTVGDQIGREASSAIKDAGDVAVDYAQHREIAHGAAADAALTDRLTNQWNDTAKSADPNDPTVAAKFREGVLEPELEKFRESFLTEGGQKFAEARVERLRSHMFEKTAADMGTLAAAAVTTNMRTLANARSNTALSDPSAVPHLLSTVDADIADIVGSSPYLKGVVGAKVSTELSEKLREQIVNAGAYGAIRNARDPESEANKWIAKYPDLISGEKAARLEIAARTQKNSARIDEDRAIALQDKIRKETSEGVRENYLKKLYSDDPKEIASVTAKGIVNDPNMTLQDKEHMIGVVKRELKPETDAKISAQTSVEIFKAIRDPNADPDKINKMIYDAREKDPGTPGSITKADMADLQKQLLDIKTPEGAALAKDRDRFVKANAILIDPRFDGSDLGKHSALGLQRMYDFETELHRQEEFARRKGVSPRAVYDPKSPYYVKPSDFRASLSEINAYDAKLKAEDKARTTPPKVGARKEFRQGWGVWNGKEWAPEGAK